MKKLFKTAWETACEVARMTGKPVFAVWLALLGLLLGAAPAARADGDPAAAIISSGSTMFGYVTSDVGTVYGWLIGIGLIVGIALLVYAILRKKH